MSSLQDDLDMERRYWGKLQNDAPYQRCYFTIWILIEVLNLC